MRSQGFLEIIFFFGITDCTIYHGLCGSSNIVQSIVVAEKRTVCRLEDQREEIEDHNSECCAHIQKVWNIHFSTPLSSGFCHSSVSNVMVNCCVVFSDLQPPMMLRRVNVCQVKVWTFCMVYRKFCASASSSGQLIFPEAMKLLPLHAIKMLSTHIFCNVVWESDTSTKF